MDDHKRGFTIIETMLFIAITGVIMAALLGGWTVLINTQRYKDSTDTLYNYLQDQYNLVYNVENDRADRGLACAADGSIQAASLGDSDSSKTRGQSSCVLVGRYIDIKNGGESIRAYAIVGKDKEDLTDPASYEPKVVQQDIGLTEAQTSIPWGAQIVGLAGDTAPKNLAVILIRSPQDGTVHTYIKSNPLNLTIVPADLTDINERNERMLCLDPGAAVSSGRQAVVIRAYASTKSSIETLGSDNGC